MSNLTGGSFLDRLLQGYKVIQHNGVALPPRQVLNFLGTGTVVDDPGNASTDVFLPSGGGGSTGSFLEFVQSNGSSLPFEPILDFIGFTVVDDAAHTRTTIAFATVGAPVRLSSTITLTNVQTNVYANTSGGAISLTFPPFPQDGQRHYFYDDHLAWGTNNLTLLPSGGQTVMVAGSTTATFGSSSVLNQPGARICYEFDATLTRWSIA